MRSIEEQVLIKELELRGWELQPFRKGTFTFQGTARVLTYYGGDRPDIIGINLETMPHLSKGSSQIFISYPRDRVYRHIGEVLRDINYYQILNAHSVGEFFEKIDEFAGQKESWRIEAAKPKSKSEAFWGDAIKGACCG